MSWREVAPITIRHNQTGLLLISFTWGVSYLMPEKYRVSFAEVFPPVLHEGYLTVGHVSMMMWGAILVFAASFAFFGERIIGTKNIAERQSGWWMSWFGHSVLATTYSVLGAAALVSGLQETHGLLVCIVSCISRPVLWWYIAWLHYTFARLPHPSKPKKPKKPPGDGEVPIIANPSAYLETMMGLDFSKLQEAVTDADAYKKTIQTMLGVNFPAGADAPQEEEPKDEDK